MPAERENGIHFAKVIDGNKVNLCNRKAATTLGSTTNTKQVSCFECSLALKGEQKREPAKKAG